MTTARIGRPPAGNDGGRVLPRRSRKVAAIPIRKQAIAEERRLVGQSPSSSGSRGMRRFTGEDWMIAVLVAA